MRSSHFSSVCRGYLCRRFERPRRACRRTKLRQRSRGLRAVHRHCKHMCPQLRARANRWVVRGSEAHPHTSRNVAIRAQRCCRSTRRTYTSVAWTHTILHHCMDGPGLLPQRMLWTAQFCRAAPAPVRRKRKSTRAPILTPRYSRR